MANTDMRMIVVCYIPEWPAIQTKLLCDEQWRFHSSSYYSGCVWCNSHMRLHCYGNQHHIPFPHTLPHPLCFMCP